MQKNYALKVNKNNSWSYISKIIFQKCSYLFAELDYCRWPLGGAAKQSLPSKIFAGEKHNHASIHLMLLSTLIHPIHFLYLLIQHFGSQGSAGDSENVYIIILNVCAADTDPPETKLAYNHRGCVRRKLQKMPFTDIKIMKLVQFKKCKCKRMPIRSRL